MKRLLYVMIGCICLGLGTLGTLIPVLPTVPFLMLAACCFARSSEKLNRWFKNTKLYQDNLEDFAMPAIDLSGISFDEDAVEEGATLKSREEAMLMLADLNALVEEN